jgi:ATP-dependent DNA ligase
MLFRLSPRSKRSRLLASSFQRRSAVPLVKPEQCGVISTLVSSWNGKRDGRRSGSDHQIGRGPAFYEKACALGVEGIVSKRADAAYAPGNRGLWLKVKCLNREEFVVIGWTDPEGARPFLGALLLGYYNPDGRLTYAGRVGTGINQAELERLWRRLQPLAIDKMPLDLPPPRSAALRNAEPATRRP